MNDSRQRSVTQNQILLLLIALTLVRGLIYASVTIPWWMGHDEEYHFAQIRLLIDRWQPNHLSQDQNWPQETVATFVAFPHGRWSMASEYQLNLAHIPDRYVNFTRPSISYYPYVWLGLFLTHQDLLFQLLTMRLVSVIITCGTIIFAFLSARQIFADSLVTQILVPWLVLFTPAFMITGSTVSDANLAILLVTVVFYLLLLEIQKNNWRRLLLALGLTILALWTKPTTYFLLPIWGLLLARYAWKQAGKHWLWIGLLVAGAGVTVLFFLPPRFQGKITPLLNAIETGINSEGLSYAFSSAYFWYNFDFFWIMLGWSVYPLAKTWYIILLCFVLLAMAGLFCYGWLHFKKNGLVLDIEQKSLLLSLLLAGVSIASLVGLGIIRYNERDGRSARYIFPVIVPLSILMIGGWRALLPTTWRDVGLTLLAVAFFLFDTMVWLNYAIPWYYPFWPQ